MLSKLKPGKLYRSTVRWTWHGTGNRPTYFVDQGEHVIMFLEQEILKDDEDGYVKCFFLFPDGEKRYSYQHEDDGYPFEEAGP